MVLPSVWCAGGCGCSLPVPAGHCPVDTGLCAAVHPSVCPAIPQTTNFASFFLFLSQSGSRRIINLTRYCCRRGCVCVNKTQTKPWLY